MNAPFPTNPSVGEFFGNWVWNGARWVCSPAAGVRVVIQAFTVSGPYMPSQGLVTAVVETWGGGGGSGGYSRIALAAALVAGGVNVTIGQGGAGSGALANTGGGPGTATSFGALCVANGGQGGSDNNGTTGFGQGGTEAPPGVGDVARPGAAGFCGLTFVLTQTLSQTGQGGMGGTLAGGTQALNVGVGEILQGLNAYPNTGAGASGACANQYATTGGAIGGGAGGSGLCVVTEYCWADVADDDCCPPTRFDARVAVTREPGPCPPGGGGFDDGV